ncbi:golgin subfamily A member 6-like protein 6 [Lates japonicus]|uniref:Golgin subfamily A member 6-like protein 6 n=1 Tax=Lates japonicus TaxID=270547 RepID=A0AAD3N9Y3_LATJO|nr:golgin subfamily A member 6-like protein 6 [Lates japonicus]
MCLISEWQSVREEELKETIRRCDALEKDFRKKLVERQQIWESRQEELEKLWADKQDALVKQVSKAEEEVKSLIIQNIQLQELALKRKKKKIRGWRRRSKRSSSSVEEEKKEKRGIW